MHYEQETCLYICRDVLSEHSEALLNAIREADGRERGRGETGGDKVINLCKPN